MKKILCLTVLLGVSGLAVAAPVCTNVTLVNSSVTNGTQFNNITAFTGASTSCTLGSETFDNFSIYVNTGYQSAANLTVTLNFIGNTLSFGTNMSQAAGDDIDLQFKVTPGILGMNLTDSPGGGVNEGICSVQQAFGSLTGTPGIYGTCGGVNLGSGSVAGGGTILIAIQPSATDWIFKDVNGVSGFSQTIVPEPVTFSLMGAGLLGLGFLKRLRKS